MHAVTCLPTVTGKWRHPGGGAFWANRGNGIFHIDSTLIEGLDRLDPSDAHHGHEPHRRGAHRATARSWATAPRSTRC